MSSDLTAPIGEKTVYPAWVSDEEIIDMVLNELIAKSGRLGYYTVVQPEPASENSERMRGIISVMIHEKLLAPIVNRNDNLD